MILGNVIRNCLRQDYFYKVLFLRLIKYVAGGWRVLRWAAIPLRKMVALAELRSSSRKKSRASRRLILKLGENSARLRWDLMFFNKLKMWLHRTHVKITCVRLILNELARYSRWYLLSLKTKGWSALIDQSFSQNKKQWSFLSNYLSFQNDTA